MKKSSTPAYWLGFFLLLQLTGFPIRQLNAQQVPPSGTSPPAIRKPLLEVLIELNRTRGAYFLFSQPQLGKTLVNPPNPASNAGIEKILSQLLRNTGLAFKKVDEQTFVILRRKKSDIAADTEAVNSMTYPQEEAGAALSQQDVAPGTISGKIIDREGKVLQGVSVTVRNTHKGTVTDLAGDFIIKAANDEMLILSFVGYSNKEIPAGLAGKAPIVLSVKFIDEGFFADVATRLQLRNLRKIESADAPSGSPFDNRPPLVVVYAHCSPIIEPSSGHRSQPDCDVSRREHWQPGSSSKLHLRQCDQGTL